MDQKQDIQKKLFESIQNSDIDKVQNILSDHPELTNTELGDQKRGVTTPLIEACYYGESI